MFSSLTTKFQELFSGLAPKKKLTEENIADAVRQVRLALLDADVNYGVASQLVKRLKERALGDEVLKSVAPGEQFVKVVHDALVELMGSTEAALNLNGSPTVILMCGLQGAGKTTHTVKLAAHLKKKKVLVAACDLKRPAAIEQLKRLSEQAGIACFAMEGETSPLKVAKEAHLVAKKEQYDLLILDTAGRLHVDEELMQELKEIKAVTNPHEVLFVASAMTGQDAVKTAQEFDKYIGITGTILTMLDGNARAGAALSIREVTGKPIKFEGVGEKISDIQLFNPESMADRILGMGDLINLVKKVEEFQDEEESKKLEKKLKKAAFTYDDYLRQMSMVKKMGSFKSLMKMLPGAPEMEAEIDLSEKEFMRTEAMILSMTPAEREERVELIPNRRRRIAKGSGTSIDDVNRMAKNFKRLKQFCKELPKKEKLWR